MRKKVTVGYDGSKPSTDAVLWAAAEAAASGVALRIVSCYSLPLAGDPISGWAATELCVTMHEDCQNKLAAIERVICESYPTLDVMTEACMGSPTQALSDNVDADDLVVVGSSSHHGAAAFWLGSTPRYLVRHSPCPVVVVPAGATTRPRRIVVGTDGSEASQQAVKWAGREAELHEIDLLIVHAWEYPYLATDSTTQGRDLTNIDAGCLIESVVGSARELFGVTVIGQLVEGSPATALLASAREDDLLVLAASGRGALAGNLFGSTVNTVLDRCPVPVVVVRGQEE